MEKKILVADDSLTIQKVVELMFSDSDYRLTCVSNGRLALERVREDPPDLILADVVMPEKNGYEVCEEIKKNPATARIPVVLLAGTFEPFDRERAERLKCDAIVSKPFDSHQLFRKVESLLVDRSEGRTTAPAAEGPRETAVGAPRTTHFPSSRPRAPPTGGRIRRQRQKRRFRSKRRRRTTVARSASTSPNSAWPKPRWRPKRNRRRMRTPTSRCLRRRRPERRTSSPRRRSRSSRGASQES